MLDQQRGIVPKDGKAMSTVTREEVEGKESLE